jgi:hypothetical protein
MMRFTFAAILIFLSGTLFAQTAKDVFDPAHRITWLGVDFSKARIVGDTENLLTEQEIQNFMEAVNRLMIEEAPKYDIAGALERHSVDNALEVTIAKNKTLEGKSLRSWKKEVPSPLKRAQIQEIIQTYDFGGRDGIGVMMNIDQFNHFNIKGSLWVTFIDMKTKAVLFTDRFTCEAGGSGTRNFWASTVYRTIKSLKRGTYRYWQKKYTKENV